MIPLLLSLQTRADDPQGITADPALMNLSVKDALDTVREQTGYEIEVVGDIPASRVAGAMDHIVLPQDIDRIAKWLGIRSHAALIDSKASTIKLMVFGTIPQNSSMHGLEHSASKSDLRQLDREPLQVPHLTAAEEAAVISVYNQQQSNFPEIDAAIKQANDLEPVEGNPLQGPYLTVAEEEAVISLSNQQQGSFAEIDTAITQNDGLNLKGMTEELVTEEQK